MPTYSIKQSTSFQATRPPTHSLVENWLESTDFTACTGIGAVGHIGGPNIQLTRQCEDRLYLLSKTENGPNAGQIQESNRTGKFSHVPFRVCPCSWSIYLHLPIYTFLKPLRFKKLSYTIISTLYIKTRGRTEHIPVDLPGMFSVLTWVQRVLLYTVCVLALRINYWHTLGIQLSSTSFTWNQVSQRWQRPWIALIRLPWLSWESCIR